ncbi:MAG: hypothetical protein JSW41_03980 [Candidatus Aenigmatarchaeota archaeon]|nr:MAG: hypothetical protein JSW41_03980 [Candidatus Aenigmarchaeota archaeon]
MTNITLNVTMPDMINITPQECVCNCSAYIETMGKVGFAAKYMAALTIAVVIYMAFTYRKRPKLFKRSIEWCIFLLIMSSIYLFETIFWGYI